jgi:molecular chaperone GrpE
VSEQDRVAVTDEEQGLSQAAGSAEPAADAAEAEAPVDGAEPDEAAAARAELAERTADLQRLQAEYTNYRRRVERDRVAVIENAKASVFAELLGVLDDLDRARAHGDLETGPLRGVAENLTAALSRQGLESFGVEGDTFDPALHEAVQHEGEGHDSVLGAVYRKGYKFGERILRTAMVAVVDRPAAERSRSASPEASDQ